MALILQEQLSTGHGERRKSNSTPELTQHHQNLLDRLESLEHPYHNKDHSLAVLRRLTNYLDNLSDSSKLSSTQKKWLQEAALRHDDSHSGLTYRQDSDQELPLAFLSNEEYAVAMLLVDEGVATLDEIAQHFSAVDTEGFSNQVDLGSEGELANVEVAFNQFLTTKLANQDVTQAERIKFIADHILATSFGQGDKEKFDHDKKHYYRSYQPNTPTQHLLCLADIGGFENSFEDWAEESFALYRENPKIKPKSVDEWVKNRLGFISFIQSVLQKNHSLLSQKYFDELSEKLQDLKEKVASLKNKDSTELKELMTKKLSEI